MASTLRFLLTCTVTTSPIRMCLPLSHLDARLSDGSSGVCEIIDACLGVMNTIPETANAALPESAEQLMAFAAGFDWSTGTQLKQHIFDVALWDDALEALALAVSQTDADVARFEACEAANAIVASARFVQLDHWHRSKVLDHFEAAVMSDAFLMARQAALSEERERRMKPVSAAEAFSAALNRRTKQDFVAVPPTTEDDERIIHALYRCAVEQLAGTVLRPLGFPATKLGLRSFVGAARARGSQRASATLGRVWHAAAAPGPLIMNPPVSTAASSERTLVLIFSSLGWHGVVRAEWGATLRAVADDRMVLAHVLDTAQSWFQTNPMSGEYDDGAWWDATFTELCAPYGRVCLLGESMGATGALRFARHATGAVVALVPQIDVRDFESTYAGRADFSDARKGRLKGTIAHACASTAAKVVLHVGQDPPDLAQLSYLPPLPADKLRVVRHGVAGHALGAGLKAQGLLRKLVLQDLLGHSYLLPAAGCSSAPLPSAGAGGRRLATTLKMMAPTSESGATRSAFGMAELRSRLTDGTAVENLLVVCDFDATLTTGNSDQCHDILGSSPSLPEEVRTAFVPLLDFSKPFPPELAGDGWWVRANDILVSHGAGILAPAIRECVRDSSIELRPGALRLLRRLAELQVPVLIVSAGYSNVIEEVLAADPVTARWCEISSNRLMFGDDGHLVAIEPGEPITSFNKGRTLERNRIWFEQHALRKTVLVLGDKPSDLQVMDGAPLDITRFGIGICNDAADDGDSSRHSSFVDYQRVFDAVVCGDKGSLEVVIEVIDGLRPSLLHKPPPPHAPGHAPGDRSMDDGRCDIR